MEKPKKVETPKKNNDPVDTEKPVIPDVEKEKSIKEIFNLSNNDAPNEKHLEKDNALATWGKKPK